MAGTGPILALLLAGAAVDVEADRDKDRIPDATDRCPDEPETYNGVDDEDGCPDSGGRVIVIRDRIGFDDVRLFKPHVAALPPYSSVLDQLAKFLEDHASLKLIEVQGHCAEDERASVASARARAVRRALIQRGVDPRRLVARGYGKSRPLCTSTVEACRWQNRRVGFRILRPAQ